jgi:hypothetical protein
MVVIEGHAAIVRPRGSLVLAKIAGRPAQWTARCG